MADATNPQGISPVPTPNKEAQVEVPVVRPLIKSVTLLDGTKLEVKKFKAARYYAAQKIYATWLGKVQEVLEANKIDPSLYTDETGKVDAVKLEAELTKQAGQSFTVDKVAELLDKTDRHRLELATLVLDMQMDEMLEKYYPEDLNAVANAVIEVNNIIENLKNFVAPIASLRG